MLFQLNSILSKLICALAVFDTRLQGDSKSFVFCSCLKLIPKNDLRGTSSNTHIIGFNILTALPKVKLLAIILMKICCAVWNKLVELQCQVSTLEVIKWCPRGEEVVDL